MDIHPNLAHGRKAADEGRGRRITIVVCRWALASVIIAVASTVGAGCGAGYLLRGEYDPADVLVLLGVLAGVVLCAASTVGALALALTALARFIRSPAVHRHMRAPRLMALVALIMSAANVTAWLILLLT